MRRAHRITQGLVMTNADLHGDRREEPALAAGQARPDAAPEPRQAGPAGTCRCPGRPPRRAGKFPDHGCYEIRFRLAGWEALAPPLGLFSLAAGIFGSDPFSSAQVVLIAIGGFFTVPYMILLARRAIVFRADQAGITLGPEVPTRQFFSEFIERLAAVTAAAAPGVAIVDTGEVDPRTSAGREVLRQVGRWSCPDRRAVYLPLLCQGDGESAPAAILAFDLVLDRHVIVLTVMHSPAFTHVVLGALGPL
jgi:hypothetical protein